MPGVPATTDKGTERVTPILGGKWLWVDFNGQFMGTPFEGHGLYGYETAQKKYLSYWLDSCGGTIATSTGAYDEKSKTMTLHGTGIGEDGKPMTFTETITNKDADTRHMRMDCKGEKPSTMEIAYKRVNKG